MKKNASLLGERQNIKTEATAAAAADGCMDRSPAKQLIRRRWEGHMYVSVAVKTVTSNEKERKNELFSNCSSLFARLFLLSFKQFW